ncbi:TlpA family protein disulfide reductase [Planctomicrobium sp. SH527]|uniref:TlpA family protein disulfide reductase n=1 Tax=Planctomicrobium sp. SH527 TaxID=3448123 RepID=UPI003F5CA36C
MSKWISNRVRAAGTNSAFSSRATWGTVTLGLALGFAGCGTSSAPETAEFQPVTPEAAPVAPEQTEMPAVKAVHRGEIQLTAATKEAARPDPDPQPAKGSVEWLLNEIAKLRVSSAESKGVVTSATHTVVAGTTDSSEDSLRRNRAIVKLASEAIVKTFDKPGMTEQFNAAILCLCDARMQLASAGDADQAQKLAEDAETLFEKDPTSFAAIESASRVLELIQNMATRSEQPSPKWTLAYAKEAQKFATNFPQETNRAAMNLVLAGQMCEKLRYDSEAETCYAWIEQTYSQTPYFQQVESSLRRLRLPGEHLVEFGGTLLNGGFVSASQLKGQMVLVAFWTSNSGKFQEDLPLIQTALTKHDGRIRAVGVNMDRDEVAVSQFVQQHKLDWPQIFFSDAEKRGEQNLVARHYGVKDVPQYWLVDRDGIVRSVNVDITQLEADLDKTLTR